MSLPVLSEYSKRFKGYVVVVVCQTCGELFLSMDYDEYYRSKPSMVVPERWYVKAGLHWITSDMQHEVVFEVPAGKYGFSLSARWRKDQEQNNWTKEQLLLELKNLAEQAEKLKLKV